MDGEITENDTKTTVWTENISSVFGAKTLFKFWINVDGAGPQTLIRVE